jgi:putative peptidoglycan lipid II flippase
MIASLSASAVSYLYYADRLNQLPLGVVGIAIGVVLLPDLSAKLAANDEAAVMASQNRSFEFALLLTLPAAVALMVVPLPIVRVLFEHGAFTEESSRQVALALAAFAAGLPAFNLSKVFLPGYFAREDTRTPMMFAGVTVATNVLGSLALFFVIGHAGIAIATSIAGWVNVTLLAVTLMRRGHFKPDASLKRRVPLIAAASAAMGVVLWLTAQPLDGYFAPSNGMVVQCLAVGVLVGAGGLVYALAVQLTGVMTIGMLRRSFARGA